MAARSWEGGCARKPGCVLHAGHVGECKLGDIAEEIYEVEQILRQRQRRGYLEFLVKWRNWPEEDSTWETRDALRDATETVENWRRSQMKKCKLAEPPSSPRAEPAPPSPPVEPPLPPPSEVLPPLPSPPAPPAGELAPEPPMPSPRTGGEAHEPAPLTSYTSPVPAQPHVAADANATVDAFSTPAVDRAQHQYRCAWTHSMVERATRAEVVAELIRLGEVADTSDGRKTLVPQLQALCKPKQLQIHSHRPRGRCKIDAMNNLGPVVSDEGAGTLSEMLQASQAWPLAGEEGLLIQWVD